MNRYKFLIKNKNPSQIIGLFPWGTIIDPDATKLNDNQLSFYEDGITFLQQLSTNNISVVLFFNQFKLKPINIPAFKELVDTVEKFVISHNVTVLGAYWCPESDKKNPFVVPNPGMFLRVTDNIKLKWDNIPVLSCNDLDLSAALKVSATPIKIGGTHSKYKSFNSLLEWGSS